MCDEEDADAKLHLNFFQELQDVGLHRNIQRGNGFVANQNFRLTGECAGDRNALTLTAGELIRITIECVGRQANNLHKFLRALPSFFLGNPKVDGTFHNGFTHRHTGIERTVRILKDHLQPAAKTVELALGSRGHILPIHPHFTRSRINQTSN